MSDELSDNHLAPMHRLPGFHRTGPHYLITASTAVDSDHPSQRVTAQLFVVLLSGSVALLGDTIHNFADALTALPIGIAFLLGRRMATRRYTYWPGPRRGPRRGRGGSDHRRVCGGGRLRGGGAVDPSLGCGSCVRGRGGSEVT